MKKIYRTFLVLFVCFACLSGLVSCKDKDETGAKKIVLTGGFKSGEVFRIESQSCTKDEVMVYLTNVQNAYEKSYGESIWERTNPDDSSSLSDSLKDTVLARISKVKVLNLMAEERGVTLSEDEKDKVKAAAGMYLDSLSESEKTVLNANRELLEKLYGEYALANKTYEEIVSVINPEISDDEARTIQVSQITIKKYHEENGEKNPYSESTIESARKRAEEALREINDGTEFAEVVARYNEDDKSEHDYRRMDVTPEYEAVAFNLSQDEVSGIVETDEAFYIIKCISTAKQEETEINKQSIIDEQKRIYFEQEYNLFLKNLTGNLNEEEYAGIELIHDDSVSTSSFFETYEFYFNE